MVRRLFSRKMIQDGVGVVCAKLRRVQSEVKLRSPVAGWPGAGDHSYVRPGYYHKYCRSHAPVSVPVTDVSK